MLRVVLTVLLVFPLFLSTAAQAVAAGGDADAPPPRSYATGESNASTAEVGAGMSQASVPRPEVKPTGGNPGAKINSGQNDLRVAKEDGVTATPTRRLSIFIPECWKGMVERNECKAAPEEGPSAAPTALTASAAAPTRAEVETLVSSLVARLEVPVPTPSVGPDPSANEWNMAVVGYPLWLWTDTPASMDSSVSGYGITITMNARRVATTFDMGDGNRVTCARMTAHPASVKPGTPSPTCGYAYSWPSLPNGTYTVTATSRWEVDWSAVGFSGTLPLIASASRELPVGELHAVVVR